jgi:hypothetical protein
MDNPDSRNSLMNPAKARVKQGDLRRPNKIVEAAVGQSAGRKILISIDMLRFQAFSSI